MANLIFLRVFQKALTIEHIFEVSLSFLPRINLERAARERVNAVSSSSSCRSEQPLQTASLSFPHHNNDDDDDRSEPETLLSLSPRDPVLELELDSQVTQLQGERDALAVPSIQAQAPPSSPFP